TLYLYLPWTALRDPISNWGDARSWDNFLAHVTGRQYRDLMFHDIRHLVPTQARHYAHYLPGQFGYPMLALGLVGLWRLACTRRRWLWATALIYVTQVFYALNYRIYNVEIYYIPSNCIV